MNNIKLLRPREAAKILNISPWALSRLGDRGPRKIDLGPRTIRYRLADLVDWIEKNAK